MKDTIELEKILNDVHMKDADRFLNDNNDDLLNVEDGFTTYMRNTIKEKEIRLQDVFLYADIPERYGYKLISGEKHTRQRDVILRMCYAANFTLEETQRALKIYGMATLYVKNPRDAVLMIAFNTRPGGIIELNQFLRDRKMEPLRTSGTQE